MQPPLDAGGVAFRASSGRDQQGIYTDLSGELRAIVDTTTPITLELRPGGLSGHSVAFLASFSDGAEAIYLATIP